MDTCSKGLNLTLHLLYQRINYNILIGWIIFDNYTKGFLCHINT